MATALALLVGAMIVGSGCEPAGPGEKMGQKLDNAGEKAADALNPKGPMEKAGENVDDALNR